MPKQKTKKAVVKRMKLTKTGKVKFRHAFTSHLMVRRSSKRKRQLRQKGICKGKIAVNMAELLGGEVTAHESRHQWACHAAAPQSSPQARQGLPPGPPQPVQAASVTVLRAERFAFAGRQQKKRFFRSLWITRLTAAVKAYGLRYSQFIHGVQKAGIQLNRKELSELAIHDPKTFEAICGQARKAIA